MPPIPRGRPKGTTTFDPTIANAFGQTVARLRAERGISQLALAMAATIERAHMGRIERGEAVPNLVAVVKIAQAVGLELPSLMTQFEQTLQRLHDDHRAALPTQSKTPA